VKVGYSDDAPKLFVVAGKALRRASDVQQPVARKVVAHGVLAAADLGGGLLRRPPGLELGAQKSLGQGGGPAISRWVRHLTYLVRS